MISFYYELLLISFQTLLHSFTIRIICFFLDNYGVLATDMTTIVMRNGVFTTTIDELDQVRRVEVNVDIEEEDEEEEDIAETDRDENNNHDGILVDEREEKEEVIDVRPDPELIKKDEDFAVLSLKLVQRSKECDELGRKVFELSQEKKVSADRIKHLENNTKILLIFLQ